jgi:hypothetical protein
MAPCAAPEVPTSQATAVFNSYLAGVEARLDQQHRSQDSFHSQTAAEETALSDYRRVLEVNLIAPFLLAKTFEKGMLETGSGSIVNAASVAGLLGIADRVAYNATGSAHLCVRGLCRQDRGAGCRPGSDHLKLTRSHLTAHDVLCLPSVVLFGLSAAVAGSFPIYGQHKASWTIVEFDHRGFSL